MVVGYFVEMNYYMKTNRGPHVANHISIYIINLDHISSSTTYTMKALILAADGVEDIELVTCIDTLSRAKIHVTLASTSPTTTVHCANNTVLLAHCLLPSVADDTLLAFDVVVLPGGGKAAHHFATSTVVQDCIKRMHGGGKWVAAICASPMALARAGLFAGGKRATIYPGMEGELVGASVVDDEVVVEGKVVTSRGPATAMPFALCLVECLVGKECRDSVARALLYC